MRLESYYQYTKSWYRVSVSGSASYLWGLYKWCQVYESAYAFHVCTDNKIPYRKIEHPEQPVFMFESKEDYIMFLLTWIAEEAV